MNPLFADLDIVGVIFTLAIIGFSILSKFLGGNDGAKKAARRRAQRQHGGNQPPAKSIEAEIEEFLRQTRGAGNQQDLEIEDELEEVEVEPARLEQTASAFDEDLKTPGQDFGQDVSQHVEQHVSRDSISTRDAHLGDYVESADERIEHHLEEVFEHHVGSIKHSDNTVTTSQVAEGTDAVSWEEKQAKPNRVAQELVEMMKSPDNVKKLFIAKEIFERREF